MRSMRSRSPRVVGGVGLVLLAIVLALAFNLDRLPFVGNGPGYYADFAEIGNLRAGSEVRIAGIKVGEVDSIDLDGAKVRVGFHVDDAAFGPQTTAAIQIKTVLGAEFLALTPAGAGRLAEGATIPLSRTTPPYEIVPAVGTLTTTVGQLDTTALAGALTTLADTFRNTPQDVRGALDGVSRLSRTIASRDAGISDLLAHLRGVSSTLAANSAQIVTIIGDSNQVLAELDRRHQAIGELLTATRTLAGQVQAAISENRQGLHAALASLDEVTAVLARDSSQLAQTIAAMRPFVTVFTSALGTGGFFDATLKFGSTLSVCDTQQGTSPLSSVLDPVLSTMNKAATGNTQPCLTLAAPKAGS